MSKLLVPHSDLNEFVALPAAAREEVRFWLRLCGELEQAGNKTRAVASLAAQFAHRQGVSVPTIWRHYSAWRAARGDWRAVINRKRIGKCGPSKMLADAFRAYCERNQRASAPAWRQLMRDLSEGRPVSNFDGDWRTVWSRVHPTEPIPDKCPWNEIHPPPGCAYKTLMRVCGLTEFEKAASRVGMAAARDHILPVLTTRVGLAAGQYFQFDDKWFDLEVNFEGQARGIRPLEFCCYDVFSASKVAYVVRPRLVADSGKRQNLNEREFRYLVADLLINKGFHRDGCTLIVEHGTAAIRADMQRRLEEISDGKIRVERSGILDQQVHAGMFPGSTGGNFHMKALCESLHGSDHNNLAALPGQVGRDMKDAAVTPEQYSKLTAYNQAMIAAMATLPAERRAQLMFPLLPFTQFVRVIEDIYCRMDWRSNHSLEGWQEAGLMISEFRLGEGSNWFPMDSLLAMDAGQRAAIDSFLRANHQHMRVRRLSPREVWMRGQAELTRLSKLHLPEILGMEDAREVRVASNGLVEFEDRYLGPQTHIFFGTVTTPDGFMQSLAKGRAYLAHTTPMAPDEMWVTDKSSGALLGIARRYDRARRGDIAATHQLMGLQAHDRAQQADVVAQRHQDEIASKAHMLAHNQLVLAGAPITQAELVSADRARNTRGDLEDGFGAEVPEPTPITSEPEEDIEKIF